MTFLGTFIFTFNAIANKTPMTTSEEINQLIKSTGVNLI